MHAYVQINQIIYIKYVRFLYINYTSIKLERRREREGGEREREKKKEEEKKKKEKRKEGREGGRKKERASLCMFPFFEGGARI